MQIKYQSVKFLDFAILDTIVKVGKEQQIKISINNKYQEK